MDSNNPFPVKPTGFLIGALLACGLYGAHVSQIYRYFDTFSDSLRIRLLVIWIWLLSTCQIVIIVTTAWKYFICGITDQSIWGEFWWPLSFQDGLIPLMACTAQLFFGYRVWLLWRKRWWIGTLAILMPSITLVFGVALAVTAHLWSSNPWVPANEFAQRRIGLPSQIIAIVWMGLSALIDGALTVALIWYFVRAGRSFASSTRSLAWRLIALTLETVLLTHMVGASMCIIFLVSPSATRTNTDIFWVLLETITELYALSMLFTLNSRVAVRKSLGITTLEMDTKVERDPSDYTPTRLEHRVEGYQGSTPFGVAILEMSHDRYPSTFMRSPQDSAVPITPLQIEEVSIISDTRMDTKADSYISSSRIDDSD